MEKTFNKISYSLLILCMILFMILFSLPIKAQDTDPESSRKKDTDEKSNNFELFAEYGIEYVDNVFQLDSDQLWRLEKNDQQDRAGGRFEDMEYESDIILQPSMGLKYNSGSPLGGKFILTTWVRAHHYRKNDRSSYPEGRIRLKNTFSKKSALTLEGTFLSGYFKRNYLSGVNDADRNGNIPREERIYSPANYDEYEGTVNYEYEIINNKKDKKISRLDIQPFAGIISRTYNSTFSNRDQDKSFGGLGIVLEFMSWIDLEMIFKYERVVTPNDMELVLFDETRAEADVNNDIRIRNNAVLFTEIDRSNNRLIIEINPSFQWNKDVSLYFGFRRRMSSYTSDNQLDIEHYNQKASRNRVKAGLAYDFLKTWSAQFEYNRINDYNDEDGDFLKNMFLISMKYSFIN